MEGLGRQEVPDEASLRGPRFPYALCVSLGEQLRLPEIWRLSLQSSDGRGPRFPGNRRGLAKGAHRGRPSQSLAPLKCSVRARRDGREVAGLARGPGGLARLAVPASAAPRPPRLPREAFSRAQSDGKKIEKLSETNVLLSSSLPLPARRHPPLKHKPEITPSQIGLLESTHYKYRHAWR